MPPDVVKRTLDKLAELITQDRYENLETDTLEIKPVPSVGADWKERYKSACAFLNTRGGILLLGIKEIGHGSATRYCFSGWQEHGENKVKELPTLFKDEFGNSLDVSDCFPPPELIDFLSGKVAVVLVDELAADKRFAFYDRTAFKRILTGDHRIEQGEIEDQREFREASLQGRELRPVEGAGIESFDLDKLNDYISALNKPVRVETVKADLEGARPFLERKSFIRNGVATTLGILVCGKHPEDRVGFRCQVHGYVDVPNTIAGDKQDFVDNVLPLLEKSFSYLLRNIQVGITIEKGGSSQPQYPEELIRETVNNALAHRDYSVDRQVILIVKPGRHIAIKNPGTFRQQLLIERVNDEIPLRRILPEAKPRNPKLADVLRVYRKWEGRGIGMATMVNLALQNQIDLPYYVFGTEEVTLYICTGQLLDRRMQELFASFDKHIESKLNGHRLTNSQQLVLAYLIKSEWANRQVRYTILLGPDNNHYKELVALEGAGLIYKHAESNPHYPIYVADRELVRRETDYVTELRELFGLKFDTLNQHAKDVLSIVYRFNRFSKSREVSAKNAAFVLWGASDGEEDIKAFDNFYRQVRRTFNNLEHEGFVERPDIKRSKYVLSNRAGQDALRPFSR